MDDFNDTIRAQVARAGLQKVSISGGTDASRIQQSFPPEQQTIAQQIIGSEKCTRSESTDGVMLCNTEHVALSKLTDYVADLKKKNGEAPKGITVVFTPEGEAAGVQVPHILLQFPTARLEALSRALNKGGADKNYPIVLGLGVEGVQTYHDKDSPTGMVLVNASAVATQPAFMVADTIIRDMQMSKTQHELGIKGIGI